MLDAPLRAFAQLRAFLARARDAPTLVLLSQVYVPDPAAVGQYLHEVAAAMVQRGMRVIVFAADSGYDDPSQRYARYERLEGVHVLRLPLSSFGKSSLPVRLAGGGIFTCQAALLAASLPRIDAVLVSTSPPMCALAGLAVSRARRAPLHYWVMDLNPDQIVATGRLAPDALPVRGFERLNHATLAHASAITTLDEFMAERLQGKCDVRHKLHVTPPWPLFDPSAAEHAESRAFRQRHGLGSERLVMYSGNLSLVHPVTTLLEAARSLAHEPLRFVFIGGGVGRAEIERFASSERLERLHFLPYQPLAELPASLAAADLHVVSMGDAMVGIVHPSKIYSALAAGRPVFALGPQRSHVARIVREHDVGWHVEHGDVASARAALLAFARADEPTLAGYRQRARDVARVRFSRSRLLAEFCERLAAPAA